MARALFPRAGWYQIARALACVGLVACGSAREPAPRPASGELGQAAALVDGEAISLDEVERLRASTGLSARAALDRLIGERLLSRYAEQHGYGKLRAVTQGVEQARVQALLAREVEGRTRAGEESRAIESAASSQATAERAARLERLLGQLAQQTKPRYDEAAIQKAFARAGD
ncbi:MAG: hypothetical protein JWN48_3840 [Myxococcaceae bacterium]|nr:hypothetical protein [Myxococcaceae bacterium]